MPKAIIFDLDNTLIDRDGAFQACLQQTFARPEDRAFLTALDSGGQGCRDILFRAWEKLSGYSMDQAAFAQILSAQLRPDRNLLSALETLGRAHKLALISNGGGHTQRLKIRTAGLEAVFAAQNIVISGEVEMEKPDPRIFWLACERLQEKPADCLYVGDLPDVDGAGARAAGLSYQQGWPL